MMVLSGDMEENSPNFVPKEQRTRSTRAKDFLTGRQYQAWADKNVTFFSDNDLEFGLHAEHSWADALTLGHLSELIFQYELAHHDQLYSGKMGPSLADDLKPQLLKWESLPGLQTAIEEAAIFSAQLAANIDVRVCFYTDFGKAAIKRAGISPDAFLQAAFQLAFKRLHDFYALTYESASTRLFRDGRTETVRSLTPELKLFVDQLVNDYDKDICLDLLRKSCSQHQKLYRQAMAGQGCDRHLFALYVASRACDSLNTDKGGSRFLKSVLSEPWHLATSQQPQRQDKTESQYFAPGGGFAPITKDGYGLSYMIPDEKKFIFHISSFRDSLITDTARFETSLREALSSLHNLISD
ncbi:Carnitine O-palmitoyltransferase 1, liver isoform [Cichlidogyrus casuarinus]|uniref:Carnitine O-palmitoyltransferase 1, liver isoform n=1 Tax=Cichlidogyrus casuarinus TaxID=1844966 RepID=A0ABD2QF30_9PLAT